MAYRTFIDVTLYTNDSICESLRLAVGKVKDGKSVSRRSLGTDAGDLSEFFNKSLYR